MSFAQETRVNKTVEYYTPPYIFEALDITFDFDPCHPEGDRLEWIPAEELFRPSDNGLLVPWPVGGRGWYNPPYDRAEQPCPAKCNKKRCVERGWHAAEYIPGIEDWWKRIDGQRNGIALQHSRTDTDWFQEYVPNADAVCFLKKRVVFVGRDLKPVAGSPQCGQVLIAWTDACADVLERSGLGFTLDIR